MFDRPLPTFDAAAYDPDDKFDADGDPALDPDRPSIIIPAPIDPMDPDGSVYAAKRRRPKSWTPERQRAFIEVLADTGSVGEACMDVGLSRASAYRLRRRHDAQAFAAAWDAARAASVRVLADRCFERAIDGDREPIYRKGQIVGYRRRPSDGLAMFLLRHHDPHTYGGPPAGPSEAAHRPDPIPLLRRLPFLLNRLLRRGRTIPNAPHPALEYLAPEAIGRSDPHTLR
jgi:hypothetical protein